MTVYFANKGLIDLDVIRVMGVSVKKKDNPIGYFGTGLKFAIATLLRTGHQIVLRRGEESFEFTAQTKKIRGKNVQRCFMNDEPLPFTTELGKNWEVWQAYRELHSNTLDEDGEISDKKLHGDTVIEVEGSAIEREFADRWSIFINTQPITRCTGLEIHPGRTKSIYYRGVRCGVLPRPTLFTYNITAPTRLSEDRIFRDQWDVEYKLETMIPLCDDVGVFTELLGQRETFEGNLNFGYCSAPSEEFLTAARQFRSDATANPSILKIVERDMQNKGTFPTVKPEDLSDEEVDTLQQAMDACNNKLGTSLASGDVTVCETLGPSVFGIYHIEKDQIFLARASFDLGLDFVIAVLFEEWCHKTHKFRDASREFQSYLLHKLVAKATGSKDPDPETFLKGETI